LYRYEKGDVIKLDTINRLAELLQISPLSLLGIGVEYYHRPIGYFERIRQFEESAEQILQINLPLTYLTSSDEFDRGLAEGFTAAASQPGMDHEAITATNTQVLGILAERKRMFSIRRPSVIAVLSLARMRHFLTVGIGGDAPMPPDLAIRQRQRARAEVADVIGKLEAEPMGLQIGILSGTEPSGTFTILRTRDRAWLAINPFRPDATPGHTHGVAMITGADEAIAAHQRVAESLWRDCLKGAQAAAEVRKLLAELPTD
jgi:hypothetical protein